MVYVCNVCGWEFDEGKGLLIEDINPNTKWEDIPDTFHCPLCHAQKTLFREMKAKPQQP